MKKILVLSTLILFPQVLHAAIVTSPMEYKHGDAVLEGYLAYDDSIQGKRPGVLVVHEWKGLNDYAKSRAEQLAQLGYVAFAVDMYGKGVVAASHEEAAKLSGIYKGDRNLMRERIKAGYEVLKNNERVDVSKIAAIGYCFGGTTVLEIARSGMDVKGVASFHGGLSAPIPAKEGEVKAKVIVFTGADDAFIKKEEVDGFQDEMRNAKADWQLVLLGGAVHSFTVPEAGSDKSKGMAYDEKADQRSWTMLLNFLNEIFES